jgi:integrase
MKTLLRHTEPKLAKGKKPTVIPKGSTLKNEWAKNVWYVHFSFNGNQYKFKEGLNRIKDADQKEHEAKVLLQSIKDDLANGFNPENPEQYIEKLTKENITLAAAVNNYLDDLAQHARRTSVDSYASKLRHLVDAYPNKQLKDITTKDIQTYIRGKINNTKPDRIFIDGKWVTENNTTKWTQKTVNTAKGVFRAFFNWCKRKEQAYITENPIDDLEQKKIRSTVKAKDTNIPYTEEDLKTLMEYLDANDPYTAFFCRFIYSTCLRPREICQLRLKDIDMQRRQITIPLEVMKTTMKTEPDVIDIEPNFFARLQRLNLGQHPPTHYIISKDEKKIVGAEPIDPEKPYKRLVEQALGKLKLTGKGYTLYSFKHTSNIRRFNNLWTVAEIMKANRHTDVESTLQYLKDITRTTDISNKPVPEI